VPGSDVEAPVGPSSEEEAAFLAHERESGAVVVAVAATPVEEPAGDLPAMDDLVKRIPMPTRDVLEELFRARFVSVRRMPRSALK
jgi:hypothetical protein